MNRIIQWIAGLILIGLVFVGLVLAIPRQGVGVNPSSGVQNATPTQGPEAIATSEAQAITDTIQKMQQIIVAAQYTFDPSQLATVMVNDPRGGEMTDEALAEIRNFRNDPTLRKDQVGILDYYQSLIGRQKQNYDHTMDGLRTKAANKTITGEEKVILDGETYGWKTSTPYPADAPTLPCTSGAPAVQTAPSDHPYPAFGELTPTPTLLAYPAPGSVTALSFCPTPNPAPAPFIIRVSERGVNPALYPPDHFNRKIVSITLDPDVARVVVSKAGVTSELVLVKMDGRWYVAGSKFVKGGA